MWQNSILEVIGNTPMVRLNRIAKNTRPTLLAKLEYMNPGGSVKDRIGITMLEAAEISGDRLPELFCGFDRSQFREPVPYPTACSPQAWAATTPISLAGKR